VTLLTAHPQTVNINLETSAREFRNALNRVPTVRRLFSITGSFGAIDLLTNRAQTISEHWNWSVSLGPLTLAYVGRD
jgi:hypothetical protein